MAGVQIKLTIVCVIFGNLKKINYTLCQTTQRFPFTSQPYEPARLIETADNAPKTQDNTEAPKSTRTTAEIHVILAAAFNLGRQLPPTINALFLCSLYLLDI